MWGIALSIAWEEVHHEDDVLTSSWGRVGSRRWGQDLAFIPDLVPFTTPAPFRLDLDCLDLGTAPYFPYMTAPHTELRSPLAASLRALPFPFIIGVSHFSPIAQLMA